MDKTHNPYNGSDAKAALQPAAHPLGWLAPVRSHLSTARLLSALGVVVLGLLPTVALAAPLPTATAGGDYLGRTSHPFWVVVDPDPAGVNCRWSAAMPANWYDPGVQFPTMDISNWNVVKTFKRNQALLANVNPAGFAILTDDQDKPWLKVSLGPENQICLIRANTRFIRPYEKE